MARLTAAAITLTSMVAFSGSIAIMILVRLASVPRASFMIAFQFLEEGSNALEVVKLQPVMRVSCLHVFTNDDSNDHPSFGLYRPCLVMYSSLQPCRSLYVLMTLKLVLNTSGSSSTHEIKHDTNRPATCSKVSSCNLSKLEQSPRSRCCSFSFASKRCVPILFIWSGECTLN